MSDDHVSESDGYRELTACVVSMLPEIMNCVRRAVNSVGPNVVDTNDVLQDVLLVMLQGKVEYRSQAELLSWIYTVSRNRATRERWRRRRESRLTPNFELADWLNSLEWVENADAADRLLKQIPRPRTREIIARLGSSQSRHSIASELAISLATVDREIAFARKLLAKHKPR